MLLSITASRLLLEAVIDACSLEIAIRWILQLVRDFIESSRPGDVRAFIEEAVVTHIDRLAATGPIGR